MTKKKKSDRESRGIKEDRTKKKKSRKGNKALRVGVIEAILIAEGFSRLIDLLASAAALSFATNLREKLLKTHDTWIADSSDTEGGSTHVRLGSLQDKFFINDLIRLTIAEYPRSGLPQKGEVSEATLEALAIDIYNDRPNRHDAYVRLAAFFEKALLVNALAEIKNSSPKEGRRL
ncbi:hypothetical protein VDQ94_01680 [Xanthomonas campestris pv. campestris]|nr:hypothetical protein [Xanthomonas campestris pv. campestris]MEB1554605.1 hypothetical protein [Xanthomonas campestris pv. campestris]